jgi:hypothetical protein
MTSNTKGPCSKTEPKPRRKAIRNDVQMKRVKVNEPNSTKPKLRDTAPWLLESSFRKHFEEQGMTDVDEQKRFKRLMRLANKRFPGDLKAQMQLFLRQIDYLKRTRQG